METNDNKMISVRVDTNLYRRLKLWCVERDKTITQWLHDQIRRAVGEKTK